MSDFEAAAERRWRAGLNLYRAGDESEPFVGDAVREAQDECLDLRNYARAALDAGLLSPLAAEHVEDLARKAYAILATLGKGAGHE